MLCGEVSLRASQAPPHDPSLGSLTLATSLCRAAEQGSRQDLSCRFNASEEPIVSRRIPYVNGGVAALEGDQLCLFSIFIQLIRHHSNEQQGVEKQHAMS
ncbi:hypothetical protein M433DRAFT_152904 [Acidomyces richmondensis BFW]|nr:MAG: hypothetical protein FE78DRAFT_84491 [Acidomyces sp. 'richmondensis']KYG46821.1 hypothetical protein M433DRAFT_152904 [Acidomyces richmondensis BFW]